MAGSFNTIRKHTKTW